uniref:Uncharacterized protein n=1 Tax=Arion vulgaris TaxID=1028688 RepID=A0A0B6ZNT5_9EUPU
MSGPTLEDVSKAFCPDNKPYKCLPYGMCYNQESYCSNVSRTIESCFPEGLLRNEIDLLAWCTVGDFGKTAIFPHKSCLYACHHRFRSPQLTTTQQNPPSTELPHTGLLVFVIVLVSWLVSGVVVCNFVLFRKVFQGTAPKVPQLNLLKYFTCMGGQASRSSRIIAQVDDPYTEQDELFELQPLSARERSKNSSDESFKIVTEKSEHSAKEKLQVVVDDHDVDRRLHTSLIQQRRHSEAADVLFVNMNHRIAEVSNSNSEQSLTEDIDLSRANEYKCFDQDGKQVWHE